MSEIIKINATCPVNAALKILGGKWKLLLIFQMKEEKKRFGELKRLVPDISEKMLIQELKKLVEAGLVHRKGYREIPPKEEYSLTENGRKVLPIIYQISEFGKGLLDRE